jgi:hypothetical protein
MRDTVDGINEAAFERAMLGAAPKKPRKRATTCEGCRKLRQCMPQACFDSPTLKWLTKSLCRDCRKGR